MNEEIKEILDKINYVYDVQLDGTREHQYMREIRDYITKLQQENERLKQSLFKSVNNTNKAMEQTEIYKSRCKKAIELYKNCKEEDYCILSVKMYEILNGSDNK